MNALLRGTLYAKPTHMHQEKDYSFIIRHMHFTSVLPNKIMIILSYVAPHVLTLLLSFVVEHQWHCTSGRQKEDTR
jgi:hypothetical protein